MAQNPATHSDKFVIGNGSLCGIKEQQTLPLQNLEITDIYVFVKDKELYDSFKNQQIQLDLVNVTNKSFSDISVIILYEVNLHDEIYTFDKTTNKWSMIK